MSSQMTAQNCSSLLEHDKNKAEDLYEAIFCSKNTDKQPTLQPNIQYATFTQPDDADQMLKVRFRLMMKGGIKKYLLKHSLRPAFDEEVWRVLEEVPLWTDIPNDQYNTRIWLTCSIKVNI